jgi:hypothetical protein
MNQSQQPVQPHIPTTQPVIIYVTSANNQTVENQHSHEAIMHGALINSQEAKNLNSANAQVQNTVLLNLTLMTQQIGQLLGSTIANGKKSMIKFLLGNKYKIVGATICICYFALCMRIVCDEFCIKNRLYWCHWQNHYSIEQLWEIPQKKLIELLLFDIHKKYITTQDPTNLIQLLIRFLRDLDAQEKIVQRYLWCTLLHHRAFITKIIPTTAKKREYAQECLQRLQLVRHIFTSWMAEQNLVNYEYGATNYSKEVY